MRTKTAFTQMAEAGSAKALMLETELFKVMAKLLAIGKSNQATGQLEYEKLVSMPKGARRVDDIEF